MSFTDAGEGERVKGAVHGVLMAFAGLCCAYNVAAWLQRRERHLGTNAVLYGVLVAWELSHVVRHGKSRRVPREG